MRKARALSQITVDQIANAQQLISSGVDMDVHMHSTINIVVPGNGEIIWVTYAYPCNPYVI